MTCSSTDLLSRLRWNCKRDEQNSRRRRKPNIDSLYEKEKTFGCQHRDQNLHVARRFIDSGGPIWIISICMYQVLWWIYDPTQDIPSRVRRSPNPTSGKSRKLCNRFSCVLRRHTTWNIFSLSYQPDKFAELYSSIFFPRRGRSRC